MLIRFLYPLLSSSPTPSFYSIYLGWKSHGWPTLSTWGFMHPLWRTGYLHKLFLTFLTWEIYLSLPIYLFIYPIIYWCQYGFMSIYFILQVSINTALFYLITQFVTALAAGRTFSSLLCVFDKLLSMWLIYLFIFEYFFTFWLSVSCFRPICCPLPQF